MPPESGKAGDQNGESGTAGQIKIDVEGAEKIMTTDDVQNLVNQAASVATNSQKVQNILKTVERYETDPDTYLQNSEAAFAVMTLLQEKGIIDDKGEPIEKKETPPSDDDKGRIFGTPDDKGTADKTAQIVMKALGPDLEKLGERMDGLEQGQSGLMRRSLKLDVQAKYPDFGDEDIARLVRISQEDQRKGLWEHAEDLDKGKKAGQAETRKGYAKEFGVNLDEFDANKLTEQGAEGGGAGLIEGKKVMFASRAKKLGIKDSVTPGEVAVSHFKATDKAR